jgi:hypothetical protein
MRLAFQTLAERLSPEWISAISAALAVVLTLVYVTVIVRTLRELGKHVEIAKNSVATAHLSSRAAINAERAWVHGWFEKTADFNYQLKVKNAGKTPARIVACELASFTF